MEEDICILQVPVEAKLVCLWVLNCGLVVLSWWSPSMKFPDSFLSIFFLTS